MMLQYRKVKHDPLSYKDAEKCLFDLLKKVYGTISKFFQQHKMIHNFDVVFIDSDFAITPRQQQRLAIDWRYHR